MKFSFTSLGCDKNTVDSEIMLARLLEAGYELTKDDAEAELIIVNTCAFIEAAQQEAIDTIIEMGGYKQDGNCRYLVVTGCLAQRYQEEIFKELPEVDAVLGTGSYEDIVPLVQALQRGENNTLLCADINTRDLGPQKRYLTTVGYNAYLKIAEGCDHHCTYCIIPYLRGKFRSRPFDAIVDEARKLAAEGVTELILVAQDCTRYGIDLPELAMLPGHGFPSLLHELAQIEDIKWIRILYCYPEEITDELIAAIKSEDKVLKYLDLPIQHTENRVLKRMGRKNTREELVALLKKLREEIPGVCLRTTLISGFPGETEAEHRAMKAFIQEARFDRLGVFPYSQEEGTPAARLPGQLSAEVKERRADELMALQQEISTDISQKFVGSVLEVLVEGKLTDEEDVYCCRSYRDAPEIDGFVFVSSERELRSGDYVQCRITDAYEYDLVGNIL